MGMVLKVSGQQITDFDKVEVELKYDSVGSTFSFDYRMDPTSQFFKLLNSPGTYKPCTIEFQYPNGQSELLITGVILSHGFTDSASPSLKSISGYSKPGVLADCEIPTSLYPLQSDGKSLKQITEKLIKPFGISLVVDPDVASRANSAYAVTTADAGDTIKSYLSDIANQKNILLSHDERGNLLLTKSKPSAPVKFNLERQVPVIEFTLRFQGQGMHSTITAIKQADSEGGNAGQSTVTNPYVIGAFRPHVFTQSSGTDNDTATAAKSALADELRNISLDISVSRWTDFAGKLWRPNTVITVMDPEINLPRQTKFFIETVSFRGDSTQETAVLRCVLPEVHNGATPKNVFL